MESDYSFATIKGYDETERKDIGIILIPDTYEVEGHIVPIKEIGKDSLAFLTNARTLLLGKNITSIGTNACQDLKYLTTIDYASSSSGNINIMPHAFEGCINLSEINIIDDITSISGYAFKGDRKSVV